MRARLGSGLVVLAVLVSGCGGGSDSADPPGASTTAAAEPTWNPCGGLDAARVAQALGEELSVNSGTADAPQCTLVPAVDGGAVIDANYVVFPEGLDAAWDQMGAPDDGSVTEPRIAGADDARIVASEGTAALGVTGFVQNGALIQIVNVVDTPPYDRKAAVAATREVMRQLSAYAKQGGAPQ